MDAVIETHLDAGLMHEAQAVYAAAGVSIEDTFRRLLERSVTDQTVPYGLFGPNVEIRAAIDELHNGGGTRFKTVADLMADLHADD